MKPVVLLKNWATSMYLKNYQAPELSEPRLCGKVYGHPDFEDGESIFSSKVKKLYLKQGRAETKNTTYIFVGPADPEWIIYLKSINYDLDKLPEFWNEPTDEEGF